MVTGQLFHLKISKTQYVENERTELLIIVFSLYTLYLSVSGITMPSLKSDIYYRKASLLKMQQKSLEFIIRSKCKKELPKSKKK